MKRLIIGAASALALIGAPAMATDATDIDIDRMSENTEGIGEYDVAVQGGAAGYLGGLSDYTGVGPVWGVRVDGDLSRGFGWEVGYTGARTPLTDGRIEDGNAIWKNGVSTMAKVYVPNGMQLRPFAGVGLGGSYLNVSEGAEGLYQNDFVAELPVAAGLEFRSENGFNAGLRAQYNFMAGEEFAAPAAPGESPEGGLLSGQLSVGGRF